MKIYSPLSNSIVIHKPSIESEINTQSATCERLKADLKADGFEVVLGVGVMTKSRALGMVNDAVVFYRKIAVAIIEFKRHSIALDQTMQGFKYRHCGVPVILFWDMNEYEDLKNTLMSMISSKNTQPISQAAPANFSERLAATIPTPLVSRNLDRLCRRLEVAAYAAFDAKQFEIERQLETLKNEVKARL